MEPNDLATDEAPVTDEADALDSILRLPAVEKASGLKKSEIYDRMKDEDPRRRFPRQVPLGDKAVGWLKSEIMAWQRARIAARNDAPVKRARAPKRSNKEAAEVMSSGDAMRGLAKHKAEQVS